MEVWRCVDDLHMMLGHSESGAGEDLDGLPSAKPFGPTLVYIGLR